MKIFGVRNDEVRLNGVNGNKVTGPNGNSLFLPAAGFRTDKFFPDFVTQKNTYFITD